MATDSNSPTNPPKAPPASQTRKADGSTSIGGGHPASTQVIVTAGGPVVSILPSASVVGETPVFQAYKHN